MKAFSLMRLMRNFNSIKVRLRPIFLLAHARPRRVFQFHKGTIETIKSRVFYCDVRISIP